MALVDLLPIAGLSTKFELIFGGRESGLSLSQTPNPVPRPGTNPNAFDDLSDYVVSATYKGFINNGYVAKVQIRNPNFTVIDSLISRGPELLRTFRTEPIRVKFRIKHTPGLGNPRSETKWVEGILAMIYPHGEDQMDYVELIIIDPVNWFLRIGEGGGGAYEGKVSDVIKQILAKYAPEISVTVPETNDKPTVWWEMRRSPRDMLSHLMHLGSSLTEEKTPWTIGIRNYEMIIRPVSKIDSRVRGIYRKMNPDGNSEIAKWEAIINPSLGHHQMGLVTAGVSATLGQVFDSTNTPTRAVLSERNTGKKLVPVNAQKNRAMQRPLDETFSAGRFGREFVDSPPEYFSGGEIGKKYIEYFDAYARTQYINNSYKVFTMDLTVRGHGEWSDTWDMGGAVVFVEWRNQFADKTRSEYYFLHGNWLVYGFEHYYEKGFWRTKVNLSKLDANALGKRVGFTQEQFDNL